MRHTICLLRGVKNALALVPHPVQVVGLDIRGRNPMASLPLGRLLRRERVDIVHVNNLAPWPDAYVASRMARCACIETFHGVEQATFSVPGWKKALYRFLVRKSERVTAVAESSKELFVRISGADPSWIQVVENGIDTEQFAPCRTPKDRASLRERLGLPLEAFVFVSVAGLRPVKDPMGLIRAYRRAFAFSDSAATVLVLVGGGPMEEDVRAYVQALGNEAPVLVMGPRDDVPEILKASDAFVLNSKTEGLSYAVLEAMSTGLPIVASAVGSNPSLVEQGRNGFLHPVGDEESLALSMRRLAENPQEAKAMGDRARKKVLERYSIDSMAKSYAELYERVLRSRR